MKYVIKNGQDLEMLLDERVQGKKIDGDWEWEGRHWYGCDAIILNAKGKWFDQDIVSRLWIYEGSLVQGVPVTKINPEDTQKVKNTIKYIQDNFDHIYQVMLETLLPTLTKWGVPDCETDEPVTTIRQIHNNHRTEVIAGMEAGCITNLQLNCRYQMDDTVYYSFIYRLNGFEDGLEIVFWKDHVVFFGDGNPENAIFEFENYKEWPTYFGIDTKR